MQRAQNSLLESTKETNETNAMNKAVKQKHSTQKEAKECTKTNGNTVAPYMNHENVQPMARAVQDVAEQIIFNGCAEAQVENYERCFQSESQLSS